LCAPVVPFQELRDQYGPENLSKTSIFCKRLDGNGCFGILTAKVMMEAGRIYGVIAQETPLLHLERELVEMKYLTAGHKISRILANP